MRERQRYTERERDCMKCINKIIMSIKHSSIKEKKRRERERQREKERTREYSLLLPTKLHSYFIKEEKKNNSKVGYNFT